MMLEMLKSGKKQLTDFTEFTWILFRNNPKETESQIFRFKKRNVIPTFTERLINRIQPFFVGEQLIPFDCLMVSAEAAERSW
jgi:hypothetical protein